MYDFAMVIGPRRREGVHRDAEPVQRLDEAGMEFVDDFPGEARRYVRRADGYAAVLVNGKIVLRDGQYTEARPGRVV